jgi:hypothetical protein
MNDELIIPLPSGGSIRCGAGQEYAYGGYLRICDDQGNEILYWDVAEWEAEGEGESVIGAAFSAALKPIEELTMGRKLVDGVWVHDRKANG